MARSGGRERVPEPIRITTASESRAEEQRSRQRRYLFSMSLRTICFVGALLVGAGWVRWVLIAGAVFLPYIAVVMANAVHARSDAFALPTELGHHRELGPPHRGGD